MASKILQYDVLERLGEGAGSVIYKVKDPATKKVYALKHVPSAKDKDIRFVEQMQSEFDISKTFDHPNLRKSYELSFKKTLFRKVTEAYLLMELVEGRALDVSPPKTILDIVDTFIKAAEGLKGMHKLGYIHCDIKPNNIIRNEKGEVKVIDFGQTAKVNTIKERIQGTPDYISPEQVNRKPIVPQTDVYNLGATLYYALTGKPVPTLYTVNKKGENSFLMDAMIATPIQLNTKVPQQLSNLVMECIATRVEKRPPDMDSIITRLEVAKHIILKANAASARREPLPLPRKSEIRMSKSETNSNHMADYQPKKIVLAYSGGLDTSVILPWLKERYPGVKLVAFAAELGQGDELKGIEDKAYKSGADEVVVMDLRHEFAEKYCFPMLRAHAIYEQDYLLGTSIARPLIAAKQVEVARQTNADAVGHGATGKGNDQVRFELTYMALGPELKIIAPWKDVKFELRDRESAVEYAQKKNIPIPVSKKKIYSQDRNLWHISHEGAEIEHPDSEPNWEACLTMVVPPEKAPNEPEIVSVEFHAGNPIAVNGKKLPAHELIAELNKIGGKHGVGVTVLAENRLIGMKSRGVYETPGGTILYEAHKALEQICIERDTAHYKQQIALRYAELVYYGQWFHPLRESLQAFIDHTNATVTGVARVRLYKGRAMLVGATSPHTLYDPQLASFSMEGYDVTAARGFIDLFGLPMKVAAQAKKW